MKKLAKARSWRYYRIVAVIVATYAAIEIANSLTLVLMHFDVIGNLYPRIIWSEFNTLFNQQPLALLPLFLFFTSMRVVAALGLWRNREWGFWMTLLACITLIFWAPYGMPVAGLEMILNGAIIFLLLLARFGNQELVTAPSETTIVQK